MWIDSHCHLNHTRFEGRTPEDIIKESIDANVSGMVNISCQIRGDFRDVLDTARSNDRVWCTVGTHPHDASKPEEKDVTLEQLVELAVSDPNIIGIGETGLDYYYDFSSPEDQARSFRKHIQACIQTGMPMVVHARDADEDIIRIMKEEGATSKPDTPLRGVMHCFSSGAQMARDALELGFYISFSGIVTFKQAEELREIAKNVPLDKILVETDAPFLAPVPHRGKTNAPAYVPHTGKVLADIHGTSTEEIAKHTRDNFFRLFDRASPK